MEPYEQVAIAFASALIDGDFVRARKCLDPELHRQLTPEILSEMFFGMFQGYADSEPESAEYRISETDWAGKRPGDIGWVYISILGDDFVEAVTVTVADVDGRPLIREIIWGRP